MKNKCVILLLLAAVVMSCNSNKGTPKLFIPVPEVDMGVIPFDSSQAIQYLLINRGERVLLIDTATASCGCTIPAIKNKHIAPGDSSTLIVNFKPVDTGYFDKRVVIRSDTDSIFSVVSFKGRAVKAVAVQ